MKNYEEKDEFWNEDTHVPHNLQIEKLILGTLLRDNLHYEEVVFLRENDFFEQFHQKMFKKIVSRINSGQLADKFSFTEFFEKHEVALDYLDEICNMYNANIKMYGEFLRDVAKRRRMLQIGKNLIQSALEDDTVPEQISSAEKQIFEIQSDIEDINSKLVSLSDGSQKVMRDVIDIRNNGKKSGLQSGFNILDGTLGGFRKGELFILAGRPATGKTALALNIAINIARNKTYGGKVLFVSLEMSYEQLCCRAIANLADVPLKYLVHANISQGSIGQCMEAISSFKNIDCFIKDCSFMTIPSLRTTVRQIKRSEGIDMLIIDYLQLIESGINSRNENREVEISKISRGLKLLAKELEISIVALSQLSRDIEKRNGPPKLSDLRGSGAIEQDADNVGILYVPDEENPDIIHLSLAKNRNGAVGEVPFLFLRETTKFTNAPIKIPEESYKEKNEDFGTNKQNETIQLEQNTRNDSAQKEEKKELAMTHPAQYEYAYEE